MPVLGSAATSRTRNYGPSSVLTHVVIASASSYRSLYGLRAADPLHRTGERTSSRRG